MLFTMINFPIEGYKWPMLDAVRCSRSRSLEAMLKSSSGDFDQLPSTAEVGFRSSSIDRLMLLMLDSFIYLSIYLHSSRCQMTRRPKTCHPLSLHRYRI